MDDDGVRLSSFHAAMRGPTSIDAVAAIGAGRSRPVLAAAWCGSRLSPRPRAEHLNLANVSSYRIDAIDDSVTMIALTRSRIARGAR